ncbi:hypothetical protein HMPREF9080_01725 [Cardiobacterium valvarum F0432]|uniref:Uncharacterized protein n=1 Tax=Cardiobacterium valvarum F0432 TaxID=797473 RepID=G9ZG24_9GAMM|nr:hypothetical protein HMPREF9080_01725 [Cardiobacterium valvarum F0432]
MFGLHVGDEFADLQVDEDVRAVVFAKRVGVGAALPVAFASCWRRTSRRLSWKG